jgi:arginyl-tRNA--protein-N-Asp/Glu arginylyltransferase
MKLFFSILCIFCACFMQSCNRSIPQTKQQQVRQFLYKTSLDTSKSFYEAHINIKQILPVTEENRIISNDIDDRDIISRSKYSREDEITILGEYLTFRGDTSTSNKHYRFKAASRMVRPEGVTGFTVQIEALFSFTRMLTQGLPPIKPMLINCATGEEINTNPEKVNEVYEIYIKWYIENKKTDFKNITLPLTGSPYCWLGEEKGMEPFLKKSL